MKMKHVVAILTSALLGTAPLALAQVKGTDVHKATGVVTNVDRAGGKVTVRHDAIQSLKWPSMTMAFSVSDKAMLDKVAKDKKVEFELVQRGRDYVITSIK